VFELEKYGSLHLLSLQKVCWDLALVFAAPGIDIHWMVPAVFKR
jgi:hypothetical protein